MRRSIAIVTMAVGFAAAVHAQDSVTTKTEVKGSVQRMTYIGCVQSGTDAATYMLNKVVPVGQTQETTVGTAGTLTRTTTTSYVLVPGERIEIQPHLGQKVEVTGMLVPGGNTRTETKIERENAPDTKIKEKVDNAAAQFQVISIKKLADTCF